jgi:serine/threonine-protein kinase
MMWCFATITATVISHVVYGLRAEVREARRFGQYVLERKLGEGGMGEVYRARHGMMRRPSALKLMRPDRAGELNLRRFEREVQLTSRLTHPNPITIFDYGRTDDGVFYYAMELLEGATLQRVVALSGPQAPGRVVRIVAMVCGALSEAHAIGLIHRDIKPANIMLCARGGEQDVVKLLDFGLVKDLERAETRDITKQLKILGTPRYMAPERLLNPADVDARSDIYALGAVGYFLLTGKPIFDGDDSLAISNQVLHSPAPRVSAGNVVVPEGLDALIAACLEKDRAARPQTAQAVVEALDRLSSRLAWTQPDAAAWWASYRQTRGQTN